MPRVASSTSKTKTGKRAAPAAPVRRGRPPKSATTAATEPTARRGRPPKAAASTPIAPARRGRPPKIATAPAVAKRGRPAKTTVVPKAAEVTKAPKKATTAKISAPKKQGRLKRLSPLDALAATREHLGGAPPVKASRAAAKAALAPKAAMSLTVGDIIAALKADSDFAALLGNAASHPAFDATPITRAISTVEKRLDSKLTVITEAIEALQAAVALQSSSSHVPAQISAAAPEAGEKAARGRQSKAAATTAAAASEPVQEEPLPAVPPAIGATGDEDLAGAGDHAPDAEPASDAEPTIENNDTIEHCGPGT